MNTITDELFRVTNSAAVPTTTPDVDYDETPTPLSQRSLPDEERHYDAVYLTVREMQTGPPRITAYTYPDVEGDWDEQYTFTVTSAEPPQTCSYRWNNGDVPVVVRRAVYQHGYAIENVRTIPDYTPELTILREIDRVLEQKQTELDTLDVPLLPALFETARELVRAANRILRCRLATTDTEWDVICRHALEEVVGEVAGPIEITDHQTVFDLARYTHAYTDAVMDQHRDEDDEPPEGVHDPSIIEREVQYDTRVDVRDDRFIYVDLYNQLHIERFVFEKVGDTEVVARRYFDTAPHAQAIRTVNEETEFTVQGHPNITRWPEDPHDLISTLISTLESLGDEYDGSWYAGAVILTAADLAYDLQMVYALADALGRERTQAVCDDIGLTGDLSRDATEFVTALPKEETAELQTEHDFLDRAVTEYQDAVDRGGIHSNTNPL